MKYERHSTVWRVNTYNNETMKGVVIGYDKRTKRYTVSWEKFDTAPSYAEDELSSSQEIAEAKFADWHNKKFSKTQGK